MSPERPLNLELLNSSLRQQETSSQALARDLKIAFVLALGFQFLIFFRFANLNDQIVSNATQIASLQKDQDAFGDIQARLADVRAALQQGQSKMNERLKSVPSSLKEKIVQLETVLGALRHPSTTSDPIEAPRAQNFQTVDQNPPNLPEPLVLGNLSGPDRKILTDSDFGNQAYEKIVTRIVDDRIIRPAFVALNSEKAQLLEQPYVSRKAGLLSAIHSHDSVLEKYGLTAGQVDSTLTQVQTELDQIQFDPPRSDRWWRTFEGKMSMSRELEIDTEHVGDQIGQDLNGQQVRLASVGSQLTSLFEKDQAQRELMASQMHEVQSNYALIQDRLETYVKPLSAIAIETRDAVLYYPVILSLLFIYFGGRYLWTRDRAQQLGARYRELGAPDDAISLTFGARPRLAGTRWLAASPNDWSIMALGLVPGLLGIVSLHRILGSPDLTKDAPLLLYGVSSVLYVLSYPAFVFALFRSGRKSSSEGIQK